MGVAAPAFPAFLKLQLHGGHGGSDGKAGGGGEGRLDNAGKEFVGFFCEGNGGWAGVHVYEGVDACLHEV